MTQAVPEGAFNFEQPYRLTDDDNQTVEIWSLSSKLHKEQVSPNWYSANGVDVAFIDGHPLAIVYAADKTDAKIISEAIAISATLNRLDRDPAFANPGQHEYASASRLGLDLSGSTSERLEALNHQYSDLAERLAFRLVPSKRAP